MKKTKIVMGMPATVEVVGIANLDIIDKIFEYFTTIDKKYSTYKPESEISKINKGMPKNKWSAEMKEVMRLCEQTKQETMGYFDIAHDSIFDPSGLVKGWAINNATQILREVGINDYCIDVAGDIQVAGSNDEGQPWRIGIRNPFNRNEIIKVLEVTTQGVATSGTAIRGQHIYNPIEPGIDLTEVISLTVVGPNIYEADRFATAAFAMGRPGLDFIASMPGFDAFMVTSDKQATFTTGFERYVLQDA